MNGTPGAACPGTRDDAVGKFDLRSKESDIDCSVEKYCKRIFLEKWTPTCIKAIWKQVRLQPMAREGSHMESLALILIPTPLNREEMNEKHDDTKKKASCILVRKLKSVYE